jgi:hypothetical protein
MKLDTGFSMLFCLYFFNYTPYPVFFFFKVKSQASLMSVFYRQQFVARCTICEKLADIPMYKISPKTVQQLQCTRVRVQQQTFVEK